jgi:hypothetical protein
VDAKLLEAHLEECDSCRAVFADLREIHAQWLPARADDDRVAPNHLDWRLRQSILKRAGKEGAQFSEAAWLSPPARPLGAGSVPQFMRLAAVIVLSVALGVLIGTRHGERKQISPVLAQKGTEGNRAEPGAKVFALQLNQERAAETMLQNQLEIAQREKARLARQLEEKEASLRASEQAGVDGQNAVTDLKQQLEAARARETRIEAELEKVRGTDEAVTMAQQQEIQELNSKVAAKSASLDREKEMLGAGREIRDLIAARNLHIIDVYDTNSEGKTSRAFGRVFYTEGKSLVFYAYDLHTHSANAAKFAFYVWGKRDGSPNNVKSLGQMSKDDQAQKRWALTVTDPKILAEIDSVFITLEPAAADGTKPSGKPLLSAYLGSPANHP